MVIEIMSNELSFVHKFAQVELILRKPLKIC